MIAPEADAEMETIARNKDIGQSQKEDHSQICLLLRSFLFEVNSVMNGK
jgi:hypothetical protein